MPKEKKFKIVIFEPVLLAIIALIAFQSYWLWKSYKEEKSSMQHRGDMIFKETVYEAHAEKIQLDTNIHLRIPNRSDAAGFVNVLKSQVRDSMNHMKSVTIVSVNDSKEMARKDSSKKIRISFSGGDDVKIENDMAQFTPQDGLVRILRGVDSLEDSLTVKDISTKYQLALNKEKLPLSFSITRHAASPGERVRMPFPGRENSSEVTLGFSRPITYRVDFIDNVSYLLKKLLPQIMVSLLLIGITVLSFVLLQRNLSRQQKLTELKNDFISNITHELKTPIATVSVAIEAMKNFNALDNPERAKEYLDISGNELQRLSLLVDKVLRISMFEKKEIELKQEWFDMRALADEIVASMRLQFEKYQAKVSVESPTGPDECIC
jgi:two-component system phosphate regulon sensor histidine kinase PhoR